MTGAVPGRQARQAATRQAPVPAPGYQPGILEILFGTEAP